MRYITTNDSSKNRAIPALSDIVWPYDLPAAASSTPLLETIEGSLTMPVYLSGFSFVTTLGTLFMLLTLAAFFTDGSLVGSTQAIGSFNGSTGSAATGGETASGSETGSGWETG